jgi:hypothetical protein
MGSGIAEVCARAGMDVVVREIDNPAASAGRRRIEASLDRAVKAGKLAEPERDAALDQITITTELGDLADRDLVIEAATETGRSRPRCSLNSTGLSGGLMPSWRPTPPRSRSRKSPRPPPDPARSLACTSSTRRQCRSWSS